jgi:hypothetical protein
MALLLALLARRPFTLIMNPGNPVAMTCQTSGQQRKTMNKKMIPVLAVPALLLTACANANILTVPAKDPVVAVCDELSSTVIPNLQIVDQLIDGANATSDTNDATPITRDEMSRIKDDKATLIQVAKLIPDPGTAYQMNFHTQLIQLSEVYTTVLGSPDGLVINETAVAADSHTNYIASFCANLHPGS